MTNASTTLSPRRVNTISTVVCVLSFKPLFTSVYDLLHVVHLFLSLQQYLGLGQARIYTNVETAMHVFWLQVHEMWTQKILPVTYPCPQSPLFTMNSSSDAFICIVSCWGSCVHLLCTSFSVIFVLKLTLILLTWRIWWAPNNASKWQMGFNSAFKGLIAHLNVLITCTYKA